MTFFALGISYKSANATLRDKVVFNEESLSALYTRASKIGIVQLITLATCNRSEVFFCGDELAGERMREIFVELFPAARLALVLRVNDEALRYLYRTAAGMESMIFGEYQILGQVKDAYKAALLSGHAAKEIDLVFRDAISAAKAVRTYLDIGAVSPSVCRAGMELVDKCCGIAGKCVFVIGSGKTGSLAVEIANECGAKSIAVCNRSIERVEKLVKRFGVKPVVYESRYDEIAQSDIVISATASPHTVVSANEFKVNHRLVILDLASPRDVDSTIANNPFVTLLSIDTIGEMANGDRIEHDKLEQSGMAIINEAITKTLERLK